MRGVVIDGHLCMCTVRAYQYRLYFYEHCTACRVLLLTLCINYLSAPSGPPQSFRVVAVSSTSIRLSWSPPLEEEQNGIIISYRVTVTEVESGERVLTRTAAASDTLLVVDSLDPHFTYHCSIAAVTIAIGPETTAQVTTLQQGDHSNVKCG